MTTGSGTSEQANVLTLIQDQHNQIKELFGRAETAEPDRLDDEFFALRRLLAIHETAEEEVIYPALRLRGEEGHRIADSCIDEEGKAKDRLAELEKLGIDHAEFPAKLRSLRDAVLAHADHEEREVLPLLEANESAERLVTMRKAFELAESVAPTRPHPHGPDSAIGNLMVGPFAAIVDRVRDALEERSS